MKTIIHILIIDLFLVPTFIKDLVMFISKRCLPMSSVENPWLQQFD
jgi:hypothetical protein